MWGWLQKVWDVIFSLGEEHIRSGDDAAKMRDQAKSTIASQTEGYVSCPWHMDLGYSCFFDSTRQLFKCIVCHRTGKLTTLLRRLESSDAYERKVE